VVADPDILSFSVKNHKMEFAGEIDRQRERDLERQTNRKKKYSETYRGREIDMKRET
jgi:hypothetical protein